MRYLWVEDFGIEDNILLHSLEDALEYLDDFEKRINFDAVLLDIRFPVLKDKSEIDEEKIYKKYFLNIITKDMFKKYAKSDTMQDALSGILLFMALVFRY